MTVTRTLALIYGTVTTGGASAATMNIDGYPRYSESRGLDAITATVSWDVIVSGTSTADLNTNIGTLETEFLTPFLRFQWKEGATTFIDWNPSDDSGFNAEPSMELLGGIPDTGLTRKYRLSVSVGLPASNNAGRINSDIQVEYSESDLRTVTFTSTYTAQGGTGALSNCQTKLPMFASSVLSGLGGTYEKLGTGAFNRDDQDKICTGTIVYKEILYNQSSSGADLASVINHSVEFSSSTVGPGDTPGGLFGQAKRLVSATGTYSASIDFGETTDLKGLWENTPRTYVINQAKTNLGLTTVAIVEDSPKYNKAENTITCTLNIFGPATGAKAYEYQVTQSRSENPGAIIRRKWNGDRYGGVVYDGPARTVRTTVITAVISGTTGIARVDGLGQLASGSSGNAGATGVVGPANHSGWILLEGIPSYTPISYGIPGLNRSIPASRFSHTVREEWISGDDGGGGGPPTVPSQPGGDRFSGGNVARPTTPGASGAGGQIAPTRRI